MNLFINNNIIFYYERKIYVSDKLAKIHLSYNQVRIFLELQSFYYILQHFLFIIFYNKNILSSFREILRYQNSQSFFSCMIPFSVCIIRDTKTLIYRT